MKTAGYRLSQIEPVQDSQANQKPREEYKAQVKIKSFDGKETKWMSISWSELCAIKNILTIEPLK